ncbi:MAG: TolC family outer membrane protein [Gammaproteobacteria bacterium]|nr:TolC family outer membrane protein [Gammaproteobacteria bacterium]
MVLISGQQIMSFPVTNLIRIMTVLVVAMLFPPALLADDLLDVYRLALENDAEYGSELAANRAARELTPQARAALLPTIRLDLSAAENDRDIRKGGLYKRMGQTGFTSKEMALTVTQPIYRKDLRIRLEQSKGRVARADLILALAREKLLLRVAERYFKVLRAMDELAFAGAEKEATEQQLHQARRRLDIGLVDMTDVQEAKARYDLAVAREVEAGRRLGNAYKALWEVTGKHSPELDPLAEDIPLVFPEPNDITRWTEIALAQNLEIAIARQVTAIAMDEIERVGAGHLPTLDLVGTHSRLSASKDQYGATDTRTSSIGFELNIPLYQGGLVLSQTREAVHLHSQSLDDLARADRSVQRKTYDAFWGVVSGISSVNARKQALQSAKAALNAVKKGFEVGIRDAVDILDSQREVFRAKRDYADARHEYIIYVLSLKQISGTLSEEDLAVVNGWLEYRAPTESSRSLASREGDIPDGYRHPNSQNGTVLEKPILATETDRRSHGSPWVSHALVRAERKEAIAGEDGVVADHPWKKLVHLHQRPLPCLTDSTLSRPLPLTFYSRLNETCKSQQPALPSRKASTSTKTPSSPPWRRSFYRKR